MEYKQFRATILGSRRRAITSYDKILKEVYEAVNTPDLTTGDVDNYRKVFWIAKEPIRDTPKLAPGAGPPFKHPQEMHDYIFTTLIKYGFGIPQKIKVPGNIPEMTLERNGVEVSAILSIVNPFIRISIPIDTPQGGSFKTRSCGGKYHTGATIRVDEEKLSDQFPGILKVVDEGLAIAGRHADEINRAPYIDPWYARSQKRKRPVKQKN